MGVGAAGGVRDDDAAFIATSFPGFADMMRALGADIS
jgi:5-enolpyruvylshikimate-3-phosphate synthase